MPSASPLNFFDQVDRLLAVVHRPIALRDLGQRSHLRRFLQPGLGANDVGLDQLLVQMDGRIAIEDGLVDFAQLAFAAGPGNVGRGQLGIGLQGLVAVGHRAGVIAQIQADRGPLRHGPPPGQDRA